MASKNVETLRAAHESWNRRDFDGLIRQFAENVVYTDHARNQTLKSANEFRKWAEEWARAGSDSRITHPQYIEAGDVVVAQFRGEGTNDGLFAGRPATGRRMSFDFCEVWHFDRNGKMTSGHGYYDLYTILSQLGHVEPLRAAA